MRCRGFTLIELLVTVAVMAILLAIGLPSFQGSMRSNRVATATNELMASLSLARSEAIRSPGGAAVCASTDGTACNGTSWNDGWIVWIDLDGNNSLGTGERVLRYVEGIAKLDIDVTTAETDENLILFDSRGRTVGAERDFELKPDTCPSGHELVRTLALSLTGQTKVERSSCT